MGQQTSPGDDRQVEIRRTLDAAPGCTSMPAPQPSCGSVTGDHL